jgi:hypothetical protein
MKARTQRHTEIVRNRNTNKMMKFLLAFAALALFVQLAAAGTRAHAAVPHRYLAVRLSLSFFCISLHNSIQSSIFVILALYCVQESMINFLNF